MLRTATAILLMCAMLLTASAWAQETQAPASEQALTNADVLALLEAGLPGRVVAAKIAGSRRTNFDTSVETLTALARDGVDTAVLEAMVAASLRHSVQRANFHGTSCATPGIFAEREGQLITLDVDGPSRRETSGVAGRIANMAVGRATRGWFFPGFGPGTKVTLHGGAATVRVATGRPAFLVCLVEYPEAAGAAFGGGQVEPTGLQLVALRVRKRRGVRTFDVGKRKFLRGTELGVPLEQLRAVAFERLRAGVYRVRPETPLAPGEYGFYYDALSTLSPTADMAAATLSGRLFTFGVDEG